MNNSTLENGYYGIQCKEGFFALNVSFNEKNIDGNTLLQMREPIWNRYQRFRVVKLKNEPYYVILPLINENKAVDISDNSIIIKDYDPESQSQKWIIENIETEYCSIKNKENQKNLEFIEKTKEIQFNESKNEDIQKFKFITVGIENKHYYNIQSPISMVCFIPSDISEIKNTSNIENQKPILKLRNKKRNIYERFYLENIENNIYTIRLLLDKNKTLECDDKNILIGDYNAENIKLSQQWEIVNNNSSWTIIKNKGNNKVMETKKTEDDEFIMFMNQENGKWSQKFRFIKIDPNFVSKEKVLPKNVTKFVDTFNYAYQKMKNVTGTDFFYGITVCRRWKDCQDLIDKKQNIELIKCYKVQNKEELQKLEKEIKEFAEKENGRVYMSLYPINPKINKELETQNYQLYCSKIFFFRFDADVIPPMYQVDADTGDETDLKKILNYLKLNDIKINSMYQTTKGHYHIDTEDRRVTDLSFAHYSNTYWNSDNPVSVTDIGYWLLYYNHTFE